MELMAMTDKMEPLVKILDSSDHPFHCEDLKLRLEVLKRGETKQLLEINAFM